MLHKFSITAAVLVLVWAGLLQRSWTNDARSAPALAEAVERIRRVPLQLGNWQGKSVDVDAADLQAAGYAGCVWRRYEDSASVTVISMLLVCGPPGRVSVHTPDACYGGVGYERVADPVHAVVPGAGPGTSADFWQADYARTAQKSERLRIFWSWHDAARWQAAENPRLAFMNLPVLYKLYVVCDITPANKEKNTEACMAFMKCLLPELDKLLAQPMPAADSKPAPR